MERPFKNYYTADAIQEDKTNLIRSYGTRRVRGMLDAANAHTLTLPPMLGRLPSAMSLQITIVKNSVLYERIESFETIAALDPVLGFDAIRRQLDFEDVLSVCQNQETTSCFLYGTVYEGIELMRRSRNLHSNLVDEIYRFIKTGKTKEPLQRVKQVLLLVTILCPGNDDILSVIQISSSLNEPACQNAIAELLFVRVKSYLETAFHLDMSRLIHNIKPKLQKLEMKPNVRIMLTHELNQIKTPDGYQQSALQRIPILLKNTRVAESIRKKVDDILRSGFMDCKRVENLWDSWFLNAELRPYARLYKPRKITNTTVSYQKQVLNESTNLLSLELYPTKDYLDLLKGKASYDCTDSSNLARIHLATPEFFNIRIYSGKTWYGNIYCLDFSEDYGCIVIDRIQIPHSYDAAWLNFFPLLKTELAKHMGSVKIFTPTVISNHDYIRKGFSVYKKSIPGKEYVPNTFALHNRLKCFESIRDAKSFWVFYNKEKQ